MLSNAHNHRLASLSSILIIIVHLVTPCLPQHVQPNDPSKDPLTRNEKHRRLQSQKAIDLFDIVDKDHNGIIDRDEYTHVIDVISNSLGKSDGATENEPETQRKISQVVPPPPPKKINLAPPRKPRLQEDENLKFFPAFLSSVGMIIATEIGDKTFFIAAVMCMRHDRLLIFSGSILALIIMTVLSSMLGMILPQFLPRQYTHIIGGILFLYFGIKLIVDARSMESGKCSDELEEVEEELSLEKGKKYDSEHGSDSSDLENIKPGNENGNLSADQSSSHDAEKVFMQALTLIFIAEWGDRSQIATIALAAAKNPWGVNIGAIFGHTLCTGLACVGGRMLAAKIDEKTISNVGGGIFLLFGAHSIFLEN